MAITTSSPGLHSSSVKLTEVSKFKGRQRSRALVMALALLTCEEVNSKLFDQHALKHLNNNTSFLIADKRQKLTSGKLKQI